MTAKDINNQESAISGYLDLYFFHTSQSNRYQAELALKNLRRCCNDAGNPEINKALAAIYLQQKCREFEKSEESTLLFHANMLIGEFPYYEGYEIISELENDLTTFQSLADKIKDTADLAREARLLERLIDEYEKYYNFLDLIKAEASRRDFILQRIIDIRKRKANIDSWRNQLEQPASTIIKVVDTSEIEKIQASLPFNQGLSEEAVLQQFAEQSPFHFAHENPIEELEKQYKVWQDNRDHYRNREELKKEKGLLETLVGKYEAYHRHLTENENLPECQTKLDLIDRRLVYLNRRRAALTQVLNDMATREAVVIEKFNNKTVAQVKRQSKSFILPFSRKKDYKPVLEASPYLRQNKRSAAEVFTKLQACFYEDTNFLIWKIKRERFVPQRLLQLINQLREAALLKENKLFPDKKLSLQEESAIFSDALLIFFRQMSNQQLAQLHKCLNGSTMKNLMAALAFYRFNSEKITAAKLEIEGIRGLEDVVAGEMGRLMEHQLMPMSSAFNQVLKERSQLAAMAKTGEKLLTIQEERKIGKRNRSFIYEHIRTRLRSIGSAHQAEPVMLSC